MTRPAIPLHDWRRYCLAVAWWLADATWIGPLPPGDLINQAEATIREHWTPAPPGTTWYDPTPPHTTPGAP